MCLGTGLSAWVRLRRDPVIGVASSVREMWAVAESAWRLAWPFRDLSFQL